MIINDDRNHHHGDSDDDAIYLSSYQNRVDVPYNARADRDDHPVWDAPASAPTNSVGFFRRRLFITTIAAMVVLAVLTTTSSGSQLTSTLGRLIVLDLTTPFHVSQSDAAPAYTYYLQNDPNIFTTLVTADHEPFEDLSNITGPATFIVSGDQKSIAYKIELNNPLHDPVFGGEGAHLHCASADVAGPAFAMLAPPYPGGDTDDRVYLTGILTTADIVDFTCGSDIATVAESMRRGRVYVNIHSTGMDAGAARGQLSNKIHHFSTELTGDKADPPVVTNVFGISTFKFVGGGMVNGALVSGAIEWEVQMFNPDGVVITDIHFHCNYTARQPKEMFMSHTIDGGISAAYITYKGWLSNSSIVNTTCGNSFGEVLDNMLLGQMYVNVHSADHARGVVRGWF